MSIRILGKPKKEIENDIQNLTLLKKSNKKYVILFLGMSDSLEVPLNTHMEINDLKNKVEGSLKLIGVTFYGKHLIDEIPIGTRTIALFEIIQITNRIVFLNSLADLFRYDYLDDRFWLTLRTENREL